MDINVMLRDLITEAVNPSVDEATTNVTNSDGTSMLVTSKVYGLVNAKRDKKTLTIKDEYIVRQLDSYATADKLEYNVGYAKCKAIANIADRRADIVASMGFKSVGELFHAIFGVAKKTADQYARIGKHFINDDYSINYFPDGTNISVMLETLAFINDEVGNENPALISDFYNKGLLTDGMSAQKVRKALLANKQKQLTTGNADASADASADAKSKPKKASADASADSVNAIDALDNLSALQASALVIKAMETVETVLKRFIEADNMELMTAYCDRIRDYARGIADAATDNDNE